MREHDPFEYDDVRTLCDVIDNCDDCPRKGDDCDGKPLEDDDEIEADGFITREEDLKLLERTSEHTAIPVRECIYPRCEECDDYHGQYCTVPMVISKQYLIVLEDKITDLRKRVLDLENLVTDEILGDREDEEMPLLTKEEYDAMTPVQKFWFDKSISEGLKTIPHSTSSDKGKPVEIRKYSILKRGNK